eukprot:5283330-Ditylum_brightwellii.AAC.1
MSVAGSPKDAISFVVGATLDPPSSALPMLVTGSPKDATSSVVGITSDPTSLVDLAICAADFSVH